MSAGHDTRAAAQVECDRANGPIKVVITSEGLAKVRAYFDRKTADKKAPRRCSVCNAVGHRKGSPKCGRPSRKVAPAVAEAAVNGQVRP